MSTRIFWDLVVASKLSLHNDSVASRQVNPIHKRNHKFKKKNKNQFKFSLIQIFATDDFTLTTAVACFHPKINCSLGDVEIYFKS